MTEGRCVEVWLYDDRMEVISPGKLLPAISLESLRNMERLHASRNPRLVRGLVDLGFMRDQGEGIPRMFCEMQDSFLPIPELGEQNHTFAVTLRNTATLTDADKEFVSRIQMIDFTREEFRALLEAHRVGQIDNARMRALTGLDTLQASQALRRLRDRNYLDLHAAGSASYYTLPAELVFEQPQVNPDMLANPDMLDNKTGELESYTGELEEKTGEPEGYTEELPLPLRQQLLDRLPSPLRKKILELGVRPRKDKFHKLLVAVAGYGEWTPRELAVLFERGNVRKLAEEHIAMLVNLGHLVRTIPETPTHPNQAYRATEKSLGPLFGEQDEDEPDAQKD